MPLPRLAIVGTGVAGLGCAYFLRGRFDLTLFEQADYAGGHTNTIDVEARGERVAFDTGFMVFNRVTYPNLGRFFAELNVPVKPTDMSFSVQHVPTGLEFCGSSLNHLFAQRRNLVRPAFYRLLLAIANAQAGVMTAPDYAKFSEPFDKLVLAAIPSAPLNILHLHSDGKFGRLISIPVAGARSR